MSSAKAVANLPGLNVLNQSPTINHQNLSYFFCTKQYPDKSRYVLYNINASSTIIKADETE